MKFLPVLLLLFGCSGSGHASDILVKKTTNDSDLVIPSIESFLSKDNATNFPTLQKVDNQHCIQSLYGLNLDLCFQNRSNYSIFLILLHLLLVSVTLNFMVIGFICYQKYTQNHGSSAEIVGEYQEVMPNARDYRLGEKFICEKTNI